MVHKVTTGGNFRNFYSLTNRNFTSIHHILMESVGLYVARLKIDKHVSVEGPFAELLFGDEHN